MTINKLNSTTTILQSKSYNTFLVLLALFLLSSATATPIPNADGPEYSKDPDTDGSFPDWDLTKPGPIWKADSYYVCKDSGKLSPKAME